MSGDTIKFSTWHSFANYFFLLASLLFLIIDLLIFVSLTKNPQ